jgi:hypothetical protein
MRADEVMLSNPRHRWLFRQAVHQWKLRRFDFVPNRRPRSWALYDADGKRAGTLIVTCAGSRLIVDPDWE